MPTSQESRVTTTTSELLAFSEQKALLLPPVCEATITLIPELDHFRNKQTNKKSAASLSVEWKYVYPEWNYKVYRFS